jgi:copper resistance protein D
LLAALAAARLVHYAAAAGLFGLSLFPLYGRPIPGLRAWLAGFTLAALLSGPAWLLLVTLNLAGVLDAQALSTVALEMGFGMVWIGRLGLAALLLVVIGVRANAAPRLVAGLSGLFLCSIALTGHTQVHEGANKVLHVVADATHLAGAGAWLGGLVGLSLMLRPKHARATAPEDTSAAVSRFSRMAYVAVGALAASGIVNAMMLVSSLGGLLGSDYGRLLLLKLALVAMMLVLAAINRLRISPRLGGPDAAAQSARLRVHVIAEQALGIAVLGCAAWLGLSQPPA